MKNSSRDAALILVAAAASSDAFSCPSTSAIAVDRRHRRSRRLPTAVRSTVLPIPATSDAPPATSNIPAQLPLDEDDLYVDIVDLDEPPKVGTLRKMLPKEAFQIDTATSLFYFGVDLVAVAASMGFLDAVVTSDAYHSWPVYQQALAVMPLQLLTGFAMWCMWCIGHDAGHTTVSDTRWINRAVGEVAHSMVCLTPFVPWALSHQKHHLKHNHIDDDYSHQWYIREEADQLNPVFRAAHKVRFLLLPFNYFIYLFLGIPDGGHVFFYGRMWEGVSLKKKLDASLSVVVSCATAGVLWHGMGTADFAVVCMAPWLVLSWWLFMVTYLQHHSEDGRLYDDDTFTFERGAFQTVDRSYGKWIDRMSHHMMSGHLVHHLFFRGVPHYRLEEATEALRRGLDESGKGHLYKFIDTPRFNLEIVKRWYEDWFFVDGERVVRE